MHPAIAQHRADISAICQRYQIRRQEVFGSADRADDFDAERSDADLRRFFGIKSELETLLGRDVDLIEPGAVRNPLVLASINQHRKAIYAA